MTPLPKSIARASGQIPLFYIPPRLDCRDNASARNAYGTAAQEIVCQTLGLHPIPIDGRCEICFDAEKDNVFFEIKSCFKWGKLVIYDWRMEKEAAAPVQSCYAILIHKLRGAREDIHSAMRAASIIIVTIPTAAVHAAAKTEPLRTLNKTYESKRNGYSRAGYNRGYRNVPLQKVLTHENLCGAPVKMRASDHSPFRLPLNVTRRTPSLFPNYVR